MTKPTSKTLWTNENPENRQEPDISRKNVGFGAEKLPFQHFNWLFWNHGQWLDYLEANTDNHLSRIILLEALTAFDSSNLLVNGNFDNLYGWVLEDSTNNALAASETNPIFGKKHGILSQNYSVAGQFSGIYQTIDFKSSYPSGKTITLGYYVKRAIITGNNIARLKIEFLDSSNLVLSTECIDSSYGGAAEWTPLFATYDVPENTRKFKIYIQTHYNESLYIGSVFCVFGKLPKLGIQPTNTPIEQQIDGKIYTDKNFGIGTKTPDTKLHIKSSSDEYLEKLENTSNPAKRTLYRNTTGTDGLELANDIILGKDSSGNIFEAIKIVAKLFSASNKIGQLDFYSKSGTTWCKTLKLLTSCVSVREMQDVIQSWGEKNSGNTVDYTMPNNFVGFIILYNTWGGNCGSGCGLYWCSSDYDTSSINLITYTGTNRAALSLIDGWGNFILRTTFSGYVYSGWIKLLPFSSGPELS